MQDLAYMALLIVFFVLAVAFVHACDRIIGPDDLALAETGPRNGEPLPPVIDHDGPKEAAA
ncbi:MAG: hypothetical protein JWM17_2971 [Actinobacteria bacterium]|jgi:hypothetical protein|nr:hypothetical protein [Actinomycetota bacterium]